MRLVNENRIAMLVASSAVESKASAMTKKASKQKPEPKPLEPWQVQDASRLKTLFEAPSNHFSQLKFGVEYELGSAGMVWQYLNGHRPLNIDAAVKFARGLGVAIDDFSPTIAAQIAGAYALTAGAKAVPVDRLADSLKVTSETASELRLLTAYRKADDIIRRGFDSVVTDVLERRDGAARTA